MKSTDFGEFGVRASMIAILHLGKIDGDHVENTMLITISMILVSQLNPSNVVRGCAHTLAILYCCLRASKLF